VVTFLPIVFYEQFKFFFNLYFLLVALSQFIPALKIGFIATYIAPLAFVLAVTMGKEAYDDYKRHLRDVEANSAKYLILEPSSLSNSLNNTSDQSFPPTHWSSHDPTSLLPTNALPPTRAIPSSKIRVGDLLVLEKNQRIPADVVLLRTSDSSGTCFIRTDQLDGETDWKLKVAVPFTQKLSNERDLLTLDAEIYGEYSPSGSMMSELTLKSADAPIKDIHAFIGTFSINRSTGQSAPEPPLLIDPPPAENVPLVPKGKFIDLNS
jgi:phospholipid-translocating ATPase